MVDRFTDALFTPREAASILEIRQSTVYFWLSETADDTPLVHRIADVRRGHASLPFVALVEAYVLRSLSALAYSKQKTRAAAAEVRQEFNTPYALANRRIAHDSIDIFIEHAPDDLARVGDGQPVLERTRTPISAVIDLFSAGEHLEDVAYEYGLEVSEVEAIVQAALRSEAA